MEWVYFSLLLVLAGVSFFLMCSIMVSLVTSMNKNERVLIYGRMWGGVGVLVAMMACLLLWLRVQLQCG